MQGTIVSVSEEKTLGADEVEVMVEEQQSLMPGTPAVSLERSRTKYEIEDGRFPIEQTKIYLFIRDDLHWSIICLFSILIFCVYGLGVYGDYGYEDYKDSTTLNEDENGSLPSGPSGSGVCLVSALLMGMGSTIWLTRYLLYDAQKRHPEIQILGLHYLFSGLLPTADDDVI